MKAVNIGHLQTGNQAVQLICLETNFFKTLGKFFTSIEFC